MHTPGCRCRCRSSQRCHWHLLVPVKVPVKQFDNWQCPSEQVNPVPGIIYILCGCWEIIKNYTYNWLQFLMTCRSRESLRSHLVAKSVTSPPSVMPLKNVYAKIIDGEWVKIVKYNNKFLHSVLICWKKN